MSTILELVGFMLVTAGAFVLFGLGVALIVGGVCLLAVAQAVDDGFGVRRRREN